MGSGILQAKAESSLCRHEKEEHTVMRVSIDDMKAFDALPFVWNSQVKKVVGPSTKPYAYMDILGPNVEIACDELFKINRLLLGICNLSDLIPHGMQIPIGEVEFLPQKNSSYSKIVCTPHTYTGRPSKYPASLLFMTAHGVDIDTTHGELFYDRDGQIAKAKTIFWRNQKGYFVNFQTENRELIISEIKTTLVTDERGLPRTIYCHHRHSLK